MRKKINKLNYLKILKLLNFFNNYTFKLPYSDCEAHFMLFSLWKGKIINLNSFWVLKKIFYYLEIKNNTKVRDYIKKINQIFELKF